MAICVTPSQSRRSVSGALARWLFVAAALILTAGSGPLQATWGFPKLVIVGYQLVEATPQADGTEYVFRARLLNLGPAIPGAVARLIGESPAVTILDDTLSFGPVGHLGTAWSSDTAAIRRHGRWLDVLSTLRWSIDVGSVNRPPTADAGADRSARVLDRVVLDGSGSADPDGDPLTYRWSWAERPAASFAELSDPSSVRPEFTLDAPGRYVLSLVVHDGTQWSSPDVVEVTTENTPPVADAGDDRTVQTSSVVQLDGSRSSDADGDALAFAWLIVDRPPASQASLDDATAVRPMLSIDAAGTYVLSLTVDDGRAASVPDSVVLRTDNSPPVANAGPDQTAQVGQQVTLDGSGSTDVDGDPLTYAWSLLVRPAGSLAVLQSGTTLAPSFVADVPGTYVAQLVVSDGALASAPDTVTISTTNSAPTADAGMDQTVVAGQVVVLDGSGSSDPDGDALSYRWMLTALPAGSAASIADPAAPVTSFVADRPGDYAVQLVVHDGQLDSAPDTAVVSTINSAPVADAGLDLANVPLATLVTLDGSASSDADGHPLTYSWSLISRPPGSLSALVGPTTVAPDFTPDVVGDYVVQLTVNDGFADSAPDTVRVSTTNAPPFADAGPDQNVPAGATVQLDGSASTDPDGVPLLFAWSLVGRPAGSSATLSDASSSAPTFVADLPGLYAVQLVVNDGALTSTPDVVEVTAEAPIVSVEASDPVAAESGADIGIFTLTRTGTLATPLVVAVTRGGSATNGVDYTAIGTTVTFAAGEASASVTIEPIDDGVVEGDETVVLALVDGAAYDVGTPAAATVTIADDPASVVTIEATDASASEAGDTGTFTISRTGNLTSPLVVSISAAGTATSGVDYAALPTTVTVPAGAGSVSLTIVPIDDADLESTEGVVLQLGPGGGYVVGAPGAAVVTIADDDTLVSVVATDPVASENGSNSGTLTVSRLGPTTEPLLIFYTVSGTADAGVDYVALPGNATFAAGAAETTVTVTPLDDSLFEGPESVVLTLGPGPGYRVSALGQAGVTIQDDERPAVTIVVSDGTASEAGPDAGAFVVARTGPTAGALTVFLDVSGAATEGVDYQSLGGSVTIPAGAASAPVVVAPIDDSLVEGAELVVVSLRPNADYEVVTPGIAALTIADDDLAQVTIAATDPNASEAGQDAATFTLTRNGDLTAPLTAFLASSGSAVAADYEALSLMVTFPASQPNVMVTLTPRADNLLEGPEELTLTILPNFSYVVGSPAAATVTIADDPVVVSVVAADPDAMEAGLDPGAFLLTRSGGNTAAALSVAVSIGGTATPNRDYVVIGGVATIPAGQTTVTIPVILLPDNLVEAAETVAITISPGTGTVYAVGSPSSATVTIADDPPVVDVTVTDADAAEAGLDPGAVTFTRTGGDLATALNVFFDKTGTATNGTDYQSLGGAVSLVAIPAGQQLVHVTIAPVADNAVEGPETAILTLLPNSGYVIGVAAGAVTIADDPPVVNVTATDPDAAEAGGDPGTFTFTRSGGNLAAPLTVSFSRSGTASNVSDFATIGSSVTFAAGQASAIVTITPVDDVAVEGPETVTLTVNAGVNVVVGASATATVTIADND